MHGLQGSERDLPAAALYKGEADAEAILEAAGHLPEEGIGPVPLSARRHLWNGGDSYVMGSLGKC